MPWIAASCNQFPTDPQTCCSGERWFHFIQPPLIRLHGQQVGDWDRLRCRTSIWRALPRLWWRLTEAGFEGQLFSIAVFSARYARASTVLAVWRRLSSRLYSGVAFLTTIQNKGHKGYYPHLPLWHIHSRIFTSLNIQTFITFSLEGHKTDR